MDNIPVEWAPVITKAWLDDEFKEQLKEEKGAHEVFKDSGVTYNESILSLIDNPPSSLETCNLQVNTHLDDSLTCSNSRITFLNKQDIAVYSGSTKVYTSKSKKPEQLSVKFETGFLHDNLKA